jgi:hypothetical protein
MHVRSRARVGVSRACWAPVGLSVLLVADFGVRVTVWSLMERQCSYLPGPKHTTHGIAFSPTGQALAVLEVGLAFVLGDLQCGVHAEGCGMWGRCAPTPASAWHAANE